MHSILNLLKLQIDNKTDILKTKTPKKMIVALLKVLFWVAIISVVVWFVEGRIFILGIKINAGLPDITGVIGTGAWGFSTGQTFSGAFYSGGGKTYGNYGQSGGHQCNFAASKSNPIYGANSTVQPSSQIVHICIKYK